MEGSIPAAQGVDFRAGCVRRYGKTNDFLQCLHVSFWTLGEEQQDGTPLRCKRAHTVHSL